MVKKLRKYLIKAVIVFLIYILGCYSFLYFIGIHYEDFNFFIPIDRNIYSDSSEYIFLDKYGRFKLTAFDNVSNDKSADLIKSDFFSYLDGIFVDRDSPYPGQISNQIRCDNKYYPKKIVDSSTALAYSLYANNRYVYGICNDDSIGYNGIIKYIYCKNTKKVLIIEYFIEKDKKVDADSLIEHLLCRNY